MNYDLFNYLKQRQSSNWLIGKDNNYLFQLIQHRLQQLIQFPFTATVLIAETDAVKFIAAFLASAIADANIFLANPSWQEREWEQVFLLVSPNLIWGDVNARISTHLSNSDRQPAIMIPTGGSSGKIRFAIHTWKTLTASVEGFCSYFETHTVNSCCLLPLFHVSGLMQFLRSFLTEGKLSIWSYRDLKKGLKPAIAPQEYFISLVPTQLKYLLASDPNWLSQFSTVLVGGAPTWRSLLDLARKYRVRLAPTYGMTETASQIATLKPDDFLRGNNSSGLILPHARVNILGDDGELLADQQIGTVAIESSSLCLGYYALPSTQLLKRFITDDLGFITSEGYLNIVARRSQTIITGGEKVFPAEVEAAILATKLVTDAVVFGLPDFQWGEAVTVAYVSKQNISIQLIQSKIKNQLSGYKCPKHWIRVEYLPRNEYGKIDWQQLKRIASANI